jgi:predicted O-linked N-acetylglucosamine transferase (SPINDLY family)
MNIDRTLASVRQYLRCGDFAASETVLAEALSAAPERLDLAMLRAEIAHEMGMGAQLIEAADAALAENPLDLQALYTRAAALNFAGNLDDAIAAAEAACILYPEAPEPAKLLGRMLANTFRIEAAVTALARATALAPEDPELGNDHAVALIRAYRYAEARRKLLEVQARHGVETVRLCNLANVTLSLGDQAEAVRLALQATQISPSSSKARRAYLNTQAYQPGVTGTTLLESARALSALLPRDGESLPAFRNPKQKRRKLRVGLLSGTLKAHPVGWMTLAGLAALDQRAFSLEAFAQQTADDWIARQFQTICDEWHRIDRLDDLALARFARARGIDILIDLGGYGELGRMPACAHRLAPIQIKWVGSQSQTSGIPEMDYFLSDRWESPPSLAAVYSERLMIMPDGYVCYTMPPDAPDVSPLPALQTGVVTFGCLNNLAKINDAVVATWAAILHQAPKAHLLLKTLQFSDAETCDLTAARFAAHGIARERINMQGGAAHREFLATYHGIDIALDPFPYSGGLTTIEALIMGVPVITMPGSFFAARHSFSHIGNAGVAENFVADSPKSYVALALAAATDLAALAALRASLRARVLSSPLCDRAAFGRNLGRTLRRAWQDWCAA